MVGSHVALRASGGQPRDAHRTGVSRVARRTRSDRAVAIGSARRYDTARTRWSLRIRPPVEQTDELVGVSRRVGTFLRNSGVSPFSP